jgi:hypothetical protein
MQRKKATDFSQELLGISAAVPFHGAQPAAADVGKIKAPINAQ